ncbi:MAG: DUF561 domain-containing protein [Candidatus Omnitrophica bacterium]|nr:DUF561 domain-containing protein [Candidatus Omnitrophota bacterium]
MKYPALQVALDFIDLSRAEKCAKEAVLGGCDILEAGTPLIKSEGLDCVRKLRKLFPEKTIVADMKIMDAGRTEVESAAKAGADIVCVLAAAADETIKECVKAGKNYGAQIQADLIAIKDPVKRAKQLEDLGVDIIGVHCAIDEQMHAKDAFKTLKEIIAVVDLPVAVAGGINSETAVSAVKAGASIIIVGGAITKEKNATQAVKTIKKTIKSKKGTKTSLYKRVSEKNIKDILRKVSSANVSDAMHRKEAVIGLKAIGKPIKIIGKVITVKTLPGDWAKPVQAVDKAEKGDVIIIDACGTGPAVWGELATHSAKQKGIAGVIINGAARDIEEIIKMGLPVYSKMVMPNAGEPKGFGEIGVGLNIDGIVIETGDWVVCDSDGICVIPQNSIVEVANRAMSVLETENRLRKEIDDGSTLSRVTHLLKWEKTG